MTSELNLVLGPMFAGKSSFLINKTKELLASGVDISEILLVNHSSDSRYDTNKICSHDGHKISAISLNNLNDLVKQIIDNSNIQYKKIKYILIDEGQFLNNLYQSITTLLKNTNTNTNLQITVCGLDGDYKQEPFYNSRILDLIPYTTNLLKLNAKCFKCSNKAPFTKRIIYSSETILVGGSNEYQPSCILHLDN